MLERTKKPPIETVPLSFAVPPAMVSEVRAFMRLKGIAEEKEAYSIEEVFPFSKEEKPTIYLRGARYREGLTQVQLAKATGIPARHISEMENGKRPIGKKNARLLADALNIAPRRLLDV